MLSLAVIGSVLVLIRPLSCLTDTLPTPLSELSAIAGDFQHVPGVNNTIAEVTSCLSGVYSENKKYSDEDNLPKTEDTVSIECRDPRSYRACHKLAATKLNECIPGRGDTIQRIHDSIYHEFCMDGGGTIFNELSKNNGEACSVNFDAEECRSNEAFEAWEASDTCTSFRAYKRCQNAALIACQEIKLTRIIKEKIQKAEKSLKCWDVMPFATPLEELSRIQEDCEKSGITGFKKARTSLRKCVTDASMKSEDTVLDMKLEDYCNHLKTQKDCWKPVTNKIDECISGRGSTVGLIYSTLLDVTCQDKDKLQILASNHQLCVQDRTNATTEACGQMEELSSSNLCTSFAAQRKCQESMIMKCNHQEHNQLILSHLERVNDILKCNISPVSETGSKPSVANKSTELLGIPLMAMLSFWVLNSLN